MNYKDLPKLVNFDEEPCFEFKTYYKEVYRTKVKMIIKPTIKALLKNKKKLQFQTNTQTGSGVWDNHFEYVFTDQA